MDRVKKATRTVRLYVGGDLDLLDEFNRLEAEKANPTSLAGVDRTRIDELAAAIRADTMSFRFEALDRRSLQKIKDKHPPREGNAEDQLFGFNTEAAAHEMIPKCLIEPDLSDADLAELFEEDLTEGQYVQLFNAVWQLNMRGINLPLSLTASTNHRNTGDE